MLEPFLTVVLLVGLNHHASCQTVSLLGSRIHGQRIQKGNGRDAHQYLGIPFAKPPIGELRFKRPVPTGPLPEVLYAQRLPNACPQIPDDFKKGFEGADMWSPNTEVSEDCLYLNVHTPSTAQPSSRLPVLVWIYGGGFYSGSSALPLYDGGILASEQNVIIVTVNYRLNFFGFFSLGEGDYNGNQGMHDQILAMKWVKHNIEAFGGNSDEITIFGDSAGGGSVSLHGHSPLSRGLFKRGIIASGSANAPWSLNPDERTQKFTRKVAKLVGCEGSNDEITSCLNEKSMDELLKQTWLNLQDGTLIFPFAPSLDGYFMEKPAGEIDNFNFEAVMTGANENEGNYFTVYLIGPYANQKENIFQTSDILTTDQMFNESLDIIIPKHYHNNLVKNVIRHEYSEYPGNTPKTRQDTVDQLMGDYYFTCPVVEQAQRFLSKMPVYVYKFNQGRSVGCN